MPFDLPNVDAEMLELCGYVRVNQVLIGDGQSVSFNLINGWSRVALTSEDLGGKGSALGATKSITAWALPTSLSSARWRYDITVQNSGGDIAVMAMKTASDGSGDVTTRQGQLVALDVPTPLEMLAAQSRHLGEMGTARPCSLLGGEDETD
jgi:hypothetical protein